MEQAAALVLVAVFVSQLIMVLVVPLAALRRILELRAEQAAVPVPSAAVTFLPPRTPPRPPLLPMPAYDWLARHRLHDMRPMLAQRANDNPLSASASPSSW